MGDDYDYESNLIYHWKTILRNCQPTNTHWGKAIDELTNSEVKEIFRMILKDAFNILF